MLQGFKCLDGKCVSFTECLRRDCPGCLPRVFRLGILLKTQYRDPNEISTTNLTSGCLRKVYWEKTRPYWAPPQKNYAALRGSLIHEILNLVADMKYEGASELCGTINTYTGNLITEKRFERLVDGILLSGTIDYYDKASQELVDFKSLNGATTMLKEGSARADHISQANIYRYLMNYPVKRIRIIYVTMNEIFQTGEEYTITRKLKAGPKQEKVALAEVPIWTDEQVLEFVRPRLQALNEALKKGKLPAGADTEHSWLCRFCSFAGECNAAVK